MHPEEMDPEPVPEAEAPPPPLPPGPVRLGHFTGAEAVRVVRERLRHCSDLASGLSDATEYDDYSFTVSVEAGPERLVVTVGEYGIARGAGHVVRTDVYDARRCTQPASGSYVWEESMNSAWATVQEGTPAADVGTVLAADSADFTSPRYAWARFISTRRCSHAREEPSTDPWRIRPLFQTEQPWFDGRPTDRRPLSGWLSSAGRRGCA